MCNLQVVHQAEIPELPLLLAVQRRRKVKKKVFVHRAEVVGKEVAGRPQLQILTGIAGTGDQMRFPSQPLPDPGTTAQSRIPTCQLTSFNSF